MTPYYADDLVTIYHGDCREILPGAKGCVCPGPDACGGFICNNGAPRADVLVTDPPYGRGWKQGELDKRPNGHLGIAGDATTQTRDGVLARWHKLAIVFGDLMLPPPIGTRQVLIYRKPPNAGTRGAMGGWRRDAEAIYLVGPWPTGLGGRTSIIATRTPSQGNPSSPQGKYDHPHAKPVDVMIELVAATVGVILDPFMGSGSSLVAAKSLGRRAIGIEIEEKWCEMAANRCRQEVLGLGA